MAENAFYVESAKQLLPTIDGLAHILRFYCLFSSICTCMAPCSTTYQITAFITSTPYLFVVQKLLAPNITICSVLVTLTYTSIKKEGWNNSVPVIIVCC